MYPQRTQLLRLLGPKTPLYKAFGLYFDAKGCRASVRLPLWVSIGVSLVVQGPFKGS